MRARLPRWLLALVLLVMVCDADAGRRTRRIDSDTAWGELKDCDPNQLNGSLLYWHGYTLAAYAPMTVDKRYCHYSTAIAEANLQDAEDLPILGLLKPGETISAARYSLSSGATPLLNPGDTAFQWVFYQFDDAIIVGLNGPVIGDAGGNEVQVATSAATTWLQAQDGSKPWTGAGFDGEYLCFRTDGSFLGAFAEADLADCRQGAATAPRLPLLVSLPDLTTNTVEDMAVLRGSGPFTAEIRDGAAGALVRTISFFDTGYTPVAAIPLPDTDNNGIAEVAVLATRNSNGRGALQVRNLVGAQLPRTILLPVGYRAVDLASAGDADNNGIVDVGVLSVRESNGRGTVHTLNLLLAPGSQRMDLVAGAQPLRVIGVADANDNDIPEYAVLSRRIVDGRALVQVTDTTQAVGNTALYYRTTRTPLDLAVVADADANGVPEIAVLMTSNAGVRTIVELRNAAGTAGDIVINCTNGHTPIALRSPGDLDANGVPDVAILTVRDNDGVPSMEMRNGSGAANPRILRLAHAYRPLDMEAFPDLDANGKVELGTLVTRISDGRIFVQLRNASGAQLPANFVFSP